MKKFLCFAITKDELAKFAEEAGHPVCKNKHDRPYHDCDMGSVCIEFEHEQGDDDDFFDDIRNHISKQLGIKKSHMFSNDGDQSLPGEIFILGEEIIKQ